MAALGAGAAAADDEILRYYWIMPENASEKTSRVVRVQGEKGERYEEVYSEETLAALKHHPAIMEARIARQTALRREALELASQLRASGKEPLVAYEEAWTQVFSRNWLRYGCLNGTCKLEDMVGRLAAGKEELELTADEKQWLLEAILEDDDCLEHEAGQALLRRLAVQLRQQGYGLSFNPLGENDELMLRFASAMQYQSNSMTAYRDALFKTYRGQIMTHTLVGYNAPWGMGVGGGVHYHQAPQQVEATEGSGNTQPTPPPALTLQDEQPFTTPGLNELPDTSADFLASSPQISDTEKDDEDKEDEEDTVLQEESETGTVAGAPAMMMSSFSMRSTAYAAQNTKADENPAAPDTGAGDALYWNSTDDAPAVWDTEQTQAWRDASGGELAYTAGSHVVFGEGTDLNKTVQIAEEGVAADSVTITGSDYCFQGGNMTVTESLNVAESASMKGTLVIGSTTTPLVIDVADSQTLTLANLDTFFRVVKETPVYEHGSFTKTGSGTLSITEATHGSISSVMVQGGALELGKDVTMDVGANRVKGGRLENVKMQVTGEIKRPVTGDSVTVHNFITSADGETPGVLRDVTLYAGTSTEYVTLHNIAFAGSSTLTGYITFEKTQTTGDMSVAAGGNLKVDNLTFDLRGLAMGDKTLIVVNEGASLSGWNAENVHFTYSGVTVNSAAVDFSKGAGIIGLTDSHDGDQFWIGSDDSMWNTASRNWIGKDGGAEAFTALSNVYFGEGGAADREISVTQDMVVANLGVTDGGYTFKGARVAVLKDASFSHKEGTVTFNNQLVVQGGVIAAAGAGSVELLGGATIVKDAVFNNLSTTIGGDMTVGGKLTVLSGDTATAGSLTITGNVTAKEMELAVSAGSSSDAGYSSSLVNVTGNLTASDKGSILIGGTAEQHYTGVVIAGNLTVNTTGNDVYFSRVHVDKLTVGAGATVHMQTTADSVAVSSSDFPVVDLYGTLALDAHDATYNHGFQVNVQDDAARLIFGSGTTIDKLKIIGKLDATGYTNVAIEAQSHSATVTEMQDLGDLTVETGSLTVNNAGGAVHGKLILDNGKLNLGEGSNDIMASGSGEIHLKNGALLDIGTTSQTLSSNNVVFLSGASSITGDADGPGLLLGDGLCINYTDAGNSIDTKLTAEKNITLNSTAAGSSLEISGLISGSGEIALTGLGSVVLSGANAGFTGQVTVQQGSTLTLQNADALSNAGVVLNAGATLALHAPDAATLNALTFSNGSSLAISSIVATEDYSDQYAVLNVNNKAITFGQADENVVLNLIFSQELDTMKTYNIMTGVTSIDNLSFNVQHNGVALDASQYTIGLDVTTGLLYISTMMGNVWDGAVSDIWSRDNADGNWSGLQYSKNTTAIFRDLLLNDESNQFKETETVRVQGTVSPGDIYFTANNTDYVFVSVEGTDGRLAAGTNIHKVGAADVLLGLAGNDSAKYALGDVDVQAGKLILQDEFAVKGIVTVEKDASLVLNEGAGVLNMFDPENGSLTYTASAIEGVSATLSGVTMDASGIWGTEKASGLASNLQVQGNAHLSYLELSDFGAGGNVTLSHVTLKGAPASAEAESHYLNSVTIGKGVEVAASASYTLSGNMVFEDTLLNNGTVTVANGTHFEIGKLQYEPLIDETSLKAEYTYQLIDSGNNGTLTGQSFEASQISINGVNLVGGLHSNIGVNFVDNQDGSFTLSMGQYTYDEAWNLTGIDNSVGIPQWDERWVKTENAPGLSRRYIGPGEADQYEGDTHSLAKWNTGYYQYDAIVNAENAARVNEGKAIVTTLASCAEKYRVVGGWYSNSWGVNIAADFEVWIDDRSAVKNIVGGLCYEYDWEKYDAVYTQKASTHILVDSDVRIDNPVLDPDKDVESQKSKLWAKHFIIGGSRWCNQEAESYVTVKNGQIYNIFGGSCGGLYNIDNPWAWGEMKDVSVTQTGTSHVFIDGGTIGEIFAAGYFADLIGTQKTEDGRTRAVELVLTGGTLGGEGLRIFGGTDHATVTGDIYVRMEGDAEVTSRLVGGSNAGTVNGNIVLDLISGTANRVDSAGLGWDDGQDYYDPAKIYGDVLVNLYSDFSLGKGVDSGIYGGKEKTNTVLIEEKGCYSRLHFAEGKKYDLGSVSKEDGYNTSSDSVVVTGFDRFELENAAHVVLGLGLFDIDMDDPEKVTSKELVISGKGAVEVLGHGIEFDIKNNYGQIIRHANERNLGRDIRLEENATLMISTSVIGAAGIEDDRTIYVQDGTTIDFSGFSLNTVYESDMPHDGLGIKVEVCGNGVDGKGAIYKGSYEDSPYKTTTTNGDRIALPKVWLTGNASVNVESGETLHMNAYENDSEKAAYTEEMEDLVWKDLDLNGNTFSKFGAGDFITNRVDMTPGTILVQEGAFGFGQTGRTDAVDMVLAADAELKLNATGKASSGATGLSLRSLSGAGTVKLNGSTLTLDTGAGSAYYGEYMTDEAHDHDQFSETTGFGYAVFSGLISDGSAAGKLAKTGNGVHYISGSHNTYTGGTQLQEGLLYLLGTSEASTFTKKTSTVSSGVAGTGAIVWNSADAELYLGHGTRIYNKGTTGAQGGFMTIGVEGVTGGVLAGFVGIHSVGGKTVTMGNVEYVEIDTHNLKSIAVDAVYADGTAYVKDEDIDRSKMLLVKKSDWDTAKSKAVTLLSDTGYNEAVYSGVLSNTSNVAAGLRKVGAGTLVLDQNNTYTGGTNVEAGTLRLRGWATLGNNAKANAASVQSGATLMFTHNGGYGDEPTSVANNITIDGTGDDRWKWNTATDGRTAALISAVGPEMRFTLSGDISGSGNVLHSGDGTLVLSGDSSYTGGTTITRGVVEVQSATGLGATADGQGAFVKLWKEADLHVTVEPGTRAGRLVTTLASVNDDIQGDVYIAGTVSDLLAGTKNTERVLHMEGNGYNAATTTLGNNGTFLLCGVTEGEKGVTSYSGLLTGSGKVVVSDATGSGTTATFDTLVDYTGDFRVEGDKASIKVEAGTYAEGSIHVAGQKASLEVGGNVFIAAGESLHLRSTGVVPAQKVGTGAVLVSKGEVSVAADAVLSVRRAETEYAYNLSDLKKAASVTLTDVVLPSFKGDITKYQKLVEDDPVYTGRFDTTIAVNQQAVVGMKADGGLTLAGGSTLETHQGHISLMGGSLKLDTLENNYLTFRTTLDYLCVSENNDAQIVLFSDVGSVTFVYDDVTATTSEPGVYYTRADRYLTGYDYLNPETLLVYDSNVGVVYLQTKTPEPTTTALGLVAVAALAARRRRKND